MSQVREPEFDRAVALVLRIGAFGCFFIMLAGLNAMFFETRMGERLANLDPDADTPISFKIVGAVSLFSWFAVLFFGRMLPYIGTGN